MISFSCPQCGMKFQVNEEFAGRSTRCTTCKNALVVPAVVAMQTVCAPQAVGAASSLAQEGLGGGVTLSVKHESGADTVDPWTLKDVLARQSKSGERYVVEVELARGGMGVVFRAVDCDIRREVALKYLLDPSNPGRTLRFIEEAQITGQLEHPNIVPVHELGIDAQKRVFFSMKMVKGRSLTQILDDLRAEKTATDKSYTLGRLLSILVNVCNALAYAHALGVVHRDLKPANIMVGDFGEVYVMDWGLAKVMRSQEKPKSEADRFAATMGDGSANPVDNPAVKVNTSRQPETELTMEGTVLGTPVYMPPEQASGRVRAIGPHSDIYSLGAILYEMLTLAPPVDRAGGFAAILKRVVEGDIVAPERRTPQRAREGKIPPELSAIAMKALAKEPGQRYAKVETLRRDIELFQEGRSVSAKDDTRREVALKFIKRNKALSAAAAAAAALVLLILIASSWINFRNARIAEQAYADTLNAQKATLDRTRRAVPALIESARLSLDRRRYENALTQTRLALDYDPENPEALLLQGQLLLAVNKDFAGASAIFGKYLKHHPDDVDARALRNRCGRPEPFEPNNLLILAEILTRQQMATLAEKLMLDYGENIALAREFLLKSYRERIETAWPGLGNSLSHDGAGIFALDLYLRKQVAVLTPLEGMPITKLNLGSCGEIRDLAPLKGMPLKSLIIYHTAVADLTPLQGMPLDRLEMYGTKVRDLTPLKGMPLAHLDASSTPVRDLTPLKGMPLKYLGLAKCAAIADVNALAGMPLEILHLRQTAVRDLTPLKGMTTLTNLNLNGCVAINDLTPLKGMKLTELDLTSCGIDDLSAVRGMALKKLSLDSCKQVRDLAPIQGMPITAISLTNCQNVQSIAALKGMELTSLSLHNCVLIADLTPLQGMKLTSLNLENCREVRDLTPLKYMPLTYVTLKGCAKIEDVTPLKDLTLATITLPSQPVKGLDLLRKMTTLTTIDGQSAGAFWKKYDGK